jgi:hypothetical protein
MSAETVRDALHLAAGLAAAGAGAYMMMAPRRLFMRAEDPAEYRPEAVEYDSAEGRWLRKGFGPALVIGGLAFCLIKIL